MISRRSFLKTAAVGAVLPQLGWARTETSPRPANFVLVHGAWHGAWCWKRVKERLEHAGHKVFLPVLTGVGERKGSLSRAITLETFYDDVQAVIECEELEDVVLVGHSFSGIVINGVVDRIPQRIRQLVYLDSVVIENGESLLGNVLTPEAAAGRRKVAQDFSGGVSLPPPAATAFGITDPADRAWVERHLTPQPFVCFDEKVMLKAPAGNHRPRVYIDCTQPAFAALNSVKQRYRGQADWPFVGLATGHDAMVTAAPQLTDLLLRFA